MTAPREHIGPNTFLKYRATYRFWPDLLMVKNHTKHSSSRIRIFTKIETIHCRHTLNLSTKFHPNPYTTFYGIMLFMSFAITLNGEESLKKLSDPDPDSDLYQN